MSPFSIHAIEKSLGDTGRSQVNYANNPVFAGPSLAIAIIDPSPEQQGFVLEELRGRNIGAIKSFASYITRSQEARALEGAGIDVVFIGLDSDPEQAIFSVETICSLSNITVMLYSKSTNSELIMSGMRAGAREFFQFPFESGLIDKALSKATTRVLLSQRESQDGSGSENALGSNRPTGEMYVFCSAKGGAGVTTIALNFAVALAEASGKKTALIDLDLPLGDAALDLGVVGKYSTIDALNNVHRLDTAYLEALMVRHESGISFLGAPGTHLRVEVPKGATEKLITVARRTFENVIVDVGSRWSWIDPALLDQAKTIYLITQVGIPELRNSNRVMIGGLAPYSEKVEVVLNRYVKKLIQVGESVIEKALTKPVRWLVPSDYVTVRDMQTAARPLVNDNTRIAQVIRSMANEAARVQEAPSIKRMFSFIG